MKISDIPARAKVVEDNVDRSNGNKIWITNPNYLPLDSTAGFPEELFGEMSAENSVDIADNYYRIMIDQEGRQAIFEPVDNHYQIESILGVGEKAFGEALHFQVKFSDRIAKFTSKVLNRFSQKNDNGAKVKVTNHFITEPKKKLDTAILSLIYSLNDGQKITIVMFAPDSTPNKIKPTDVFVAYRFLLNQKDITNVVAPQKGKDIPIEKVAKVVMGLAAKNSAKFEKRNNEKTEAENLIKKSTKQIQKQEDYASSLLFFNKLLNNISRVFEEVSKNHPDGETEAVDSNQETEKISLKNAGKELDKETERNYLLAKSEASLKQANAMIEELKEILAEDNEVNAAQEEIYHHITEKLAGYYSAEDEEIKAKAKEIEVLLDDVGEKINTTKNLASQTRIPQEKNHVLSVEKQLGKIDEEILKQQGMLMGESEEELGVDKESESISPAGSLQAEGENFGEAGRKQPKQAVFEVDDDRTARGFYLTVNYGQRLKADRLLEKLHNFHREGYYEEDEAILDKLEKLKTVLTIQAPESRFGQKQKFKERGDVFVGKTYEGPFGDLWDDNWGDQTDWDEDFGEAGSNEESLKKWNGVKKIVKNQGKEFIMFEQGQFYEVYEENAEKLSMLLNIQTTKRSGLLMAGFGVFTASKYIDKLKKKGIDPKIKTYDKDKKAWVDKKGNVNKTSYGELENAEEENFGEGAKKVTLATLKAHARKDNLLYRVSDELGDTVGFVDPYKKYSKTFKEAKLSYFEYEKRGNPFMLFSNPYIKLEPDGEVTLNTDTHIVKLKLKEGKFGEEESFEENTTEGLSDNNTVFLGTDNGQNDKGNETSFIGETENAEEDAEDFGEESQDIAKEKKFKTKKFNVPYKIWEDAITLKIKYLKDHLLLVQGEERVFAFWIEDKKNHFAMTLGLQPHNVEPYYIHILGFWRHNKNKIDNQRDFYIALNRTFNLQGEKLKIAKMNDSEWRLENSKKMGEAENTETDHLEVETIGEGETLHTDNLEAEIKAEIESEVEAQDFGENGEISNFGEMSFKKTKTIKKDGMTFKTDYKDWDKVDELPASFEIHSPDLKGVHIEAKRIGATYGGLSRYYRVVLLKDNKTIYTNKGNEFVGLPSAEARGRLFLKKYKLEKKWQKK